MKLSDTWHYSAEMGQIIRIRQPNHESQDPTVQKLIQKFSANKHEYFQAHQDELLRNSELESLRNVFHALRKMVDDLAVEE